MASGAQTQPLKSLRVLIYADKTPEFEVEPWLEELEAELAVATDMNQALSLLGGSAYDCVLLTAKEARDLAPLVGIGTVPVLVVDHTPRVHAAVRAMREGAFGYVGDARALHATLDELVRARRPDIVRPIWSDAERAVCARIVNRSSIMNRVVERVRTVARTPQTTVLLLGESGVGKEMIATAIHALSERSQKPFIAVDCSAIPETLVESELFGHEAGAFTGATRERIGRVQMAHGGTLFLDEIGDLPLSQQAKLLRCLEERQIWRVGGKEPLGIDVRVVAATNRDLAQMVTAKTFRADLYYRLNVFPIELPPLRARGADVLHLADHFIAHFNQQLGRTIRGLTPGARAKLVSYSFPGNVRELRNLMETACISCTGELIQEEDVTRAGLEAPPVAPATAPTSGEAFIAPWGPGMLEALEREAIRRALQKTDGNQTRAAELLGINRLALARAMVRHGLKEG